MMALDSGSDDFGDEFGHIASLTDFLIRAAVHSTRVSTVEFASKISFTAVFVIDHMRRDDTLRSNHDHDFNFISFSNLVLCPSDVQALCLSCVEVVSVMYVV